MSTEGDIFISYSREPEALPFVARLKRDLEENRFNVLADVPPGPNWHGDGGGALVRCRALIAVITKKYVNSPYCSDELFTADRENKRIYFVIVEDVDFQANETSGGVQYLIIKSKPTTPFMFRSGVDDYWTSFGHLIQKLKGKGRSL